MSQLDFESVSRYKLTQVFVKFMFYCAVFCVRRIRILFVTMVGVILGLTGLENWFGRLCGFRSWRGVLLNRPMRNFLGSLLRLGRDSCSRFGLAFSTIRFLFWGRSSDLL